MSEKTNPAIASIVATLRSTGTGVRKLEILEEWAKANPDSDSNTMLCWAEDLYATRPDLLGEGTLLKLGQLIAGDTYGIRRRGETASDEVKRLNAELAELRKQLAANSAGSGSQTARIAVLEARAKAAEAENAELRRQIEILTSTGEALANEPPEEATPIPRSRGVRPRHGKKEEELAESAT